MLPFKKILYPTDFSDPSYEALKAANELALHFSAELCVVHVVSPVAQAPADPSGSDYLALQEMEKAARESLKKWLRKGWQRNYWCVKLSCWGEPLRKSYRSVKGREWTLSL